MQGPYDRMVTEKEDIKKEASSKMRWQILTSGTLFHLLHIISLHFVSFHALSAHISQPE